MPPDRKIITVYSAGVVQGVALVTFPAAAGVLTSPYEYGFSNTEYRSMFVPQAIMAIVAALPRAGLRSHLGSKGIYLLGPLQTRAGLDLSVIYCGTRVVAPA